MLICKGALLAENKWVAISYLFSLCVRKDSRLALVFGDRIQQVSDEIFIAVVSAFCLR